MQESTFLAGLPLAERIALERSLDYPDAVLRELDLVTVSLHSSVAPSRNSTRATARLSVAVAVLATVPDTVAPVVGAERATVGAIRSLLIVTLTPDEVPTCSTFVIRWQLAKVVLSVGP